MELYVAYKDYAWMMDLVEEMWKMWPWRCTARPK